MKRENIEKLFTQHRIVFVYDEGYQLWQEIDALDLPGVTKLQIDRNEFSLKVRVLFEEPEHKFLLYKFGERPAEDDDWLLELRLANTEYRADRVSELLIELDLDERFRDILTSERQPVVTALEFFRAKARTEKLRAAIESKTETVKSLSVKMLAVACSLKSDSALEDVVRELIVEEGLARAEGIVRKKWESICNTGLESALRMCLKSEYGYVCEHVNMWDFALVLFDEAYRRSVDPGARRALTNQAKHLFDCLRHGVARKVCIALSDQIRIAHGIEFDETNVRAHQGCDVYREIDSCMVDYLARRVTNETLQPEEVVRIVSQRRALFWGADFENDYRAIESASEFLSLLRQISFACSDFGQGVERYVQVWHRFDMLYRKFTRSSEAASGESLSGLKKAMHAKYVTNCLMPMAQSVQETIASIADIRNASVIRQRDFHAQFTGSVKDGEKCYVFISDALRYEIGVELAHRLTQNNRYDVTLKPMLASVPTYTQLGMASLLPHKNLRIEDDGRILANEMPTAGVEARSAVLHAAEPGGAVAIRIEDLKAMDRDDIREMQKNNRVIYVYQNVIDKVGDSAVSESRVFDAVEDALEELVSVFKKVGGLNNTKHFHFTSDHGFLYQHNPVEESDFISTPDKECTITYQGRRFLLGHGLKDCEGLMRFTAKELALDGDGEVQIAKSLLRMKLKGSGSRYTHGGATLQELVIPVVSVHRKDADDVKKVDVTVLKGGAANRITTSCFSVKLYQSEPVGGKVLPRTIRISLKADDGALLSDVHELIFNSTGAQVSDREKVVEFTLTAAAENLTNCNVDLALEERIDDTNQYRPYDKVVYQLARRNMMPLDF